MWASPLPFARNLRSKRQILELRGGCVEEENDMSDSDKGETAAELHSEPSATTATIQDASGGTNASKPVKISTAREGLVEFHYQKGEVFYNKVRVPFHIGVCKFV
jgi:hypothetical protein